MRAWTIRSVVASSLCLGAFVGICGCSEETNPLDPSFGTVDLSDPLALNQGGEDVPFGPLLITAEAFDPDNELRIRFVAEALDGRNPPFDQLVWDFGDGNEGIGTRTVHEYEEEGEFLARVEGFDCIFRTLEADEENGTPTIREAASLLDFVVKVKRFKVTVKAEPGQGHTPLASQFTGQVRLPCGHSAAGYHWNFGDGTTSDDSLTVQHTFADPNWYLVKLAVITNRDWAYEGTTIVEALPPNEAPRAQIQAAPSAGEAPLIVSFDGSDSTDPDGDDIVSYDWDFGDGQTGSGVSSQHIYGSGGEYVARLTVTDAHGATGTAETTISVASANQPPTACIDVSQLTGRAPLQVTFSGACSADPDGQIESYNWDLGDGHSTGGQEVTHTYQYDPDQPTYTAILTVRDDQGATDQESITITVEPGLERVVILGNASVPEGGTRQYTAFAQYQDGSEREVTGQAQWSIMTGPGWIGQDGVYHAPESVTATTPVRLHVAYTENEVAVEGSKTIWVLQQELALTDLAVTGPISVAEGASVGYTATATYDDATTADVTDGATWSVASGPGSINSSGLYTAPTSVTGDTPVTLRAVYSEGGVTKSDEQAVTVTNVNTPPMVQGHSVYLMMDSAETVTLTGSDDDGDDLTFSIVAAPADGSLSGLDNSAQNSATVTYTPNANFSGTDSFTFRATDGSEESALATVTMIVYPEVRFSLTVYEGPQPLTTVCTAHTVNGAGLPQGQYIWAFDGVEESGPLATHSERTHVFDSVGVHTVTLTLVLAGLSVPVGCNSTQTGQLEAQVTVLTPASLSVTPADGLSASGPEGGPFSPSSKIFTVTNIGGEMAVDWSVSKTQNWVTLSNTGGTLAPGANDTVTVSINAQGNSLNVGTHTDIVTFTNESNGQGSATRPVELSISTPSDCETSTANWQNFSFALQTGVFMAECEATPSQANMDGVVAISSGAGAGYSDFAVLVRFNDAGSIDARNGASYTANATIPYGVGTSYHFRFVIDIPSKMYDVYVTPQGSSEETLGADYAFRAEQNGVGSLANWALIADPGSVEVCNFTIGTAPGALSVAPTEPFSTSGFEGGPFSPGAKQYTLANTGGSPIDWAAGRTQTWLSLSETSGTLHPGASTTVTVSVNSNANSLAADVYPDTITFINTTNHDGDTTRSVSLAVDPAPGPLSVTPDEEFSSSGSEGGPFSPSTNQYTLTNTGGSSIAWTAGKTQAWVSLSKTSGALAAGGSDTVTVSINTNANALPAGSYSDTVAFADTTNGDTTTRSVSLMVNGGTIYYVDKNHPNANDSNDGTDESAPWRTLAKAANAAQAGNVVLVKAGSYQETLRPANDGTPGSPIVFKAYPGQECQGEYGGTKTACQVIIDGANSRSNGVDLSRPVKYVRIEGFEIRNHTDDSIYFQGYYDQGVEGIEIVNNYIHDNGGNGIGAGDGMRCLYENNEIYANGLSAIFIGGYHDSEEIVIRANNIHYNAKDGVDGEANDIVIEYNRMYDQVHTNLHQDAVVMEAGTDVVIRYNLIYDFTQLLYFGAIAGDTTRLENIEMYGNILYNDRYWRDYGGETQGIFFDGTQNGSAPTRNVHIHSNTFGWLGYDSIWFFSHPSAPVSNIKIRNNIFYDGRNGISTDRPGAFDSDYNVFFNTGRPSFEGSHSIIADPRFVNYQRHSSWDFRLQSSSPAIDQGDPSLGTVFTLPSDFQDMDGVSRPQGGGYDMGACEFQQ